MKSIIFFIISIVFFVSCDIDSQLTEPGGITFVRYASRLQLKFENGEYCTWAVGENGRYKADKKGFMSMFQELHFKYSTASDTIKSEFIISVAAYGPVMWEGEIEWIKVGECTAYGISVEDCPVPTIWPRTREITIPDTFMVWAP